MNRPTRITVSGFPAGAVRGCGGRRGFTLLELTMSLGILAIIMVGAESAIMLASHAIPNDRSLPTQSVRSRQGLDALNADLMFATAVTELGSKAITFQVADRTGDGNPETIRWAWSGTPGAALTRQYQTDPTKSVLLATPVTVAGSVYNFALGYDRRQVSAPPSSSEGAEQLLFENTPEPGLLGLGASFDYMGVTSSTSMAQPFKPSSLPANATGWRVTRVKYKARSSGSAIGQYSVQIVNSSSGVPTATPLDSVTMSEAALGTDTIWQTAGFSQTRTVDVGSEQAVAIKWVSDSVACEIYYQSGGGLLGGVLGLVLGGGGGSGALYFQVYGTVSSPDPPGYNYYLQNVRQTFQIGSDARSTIQSTCRMLNEPQVPAP